MSIKQMWTELPTVSNVNLTDITCVIQGYDPDVSLGDSVQATLQQITDLVQFNIILYNAGNPNGLVAGKTFQLCWDTTNEILYICTTTGDAVAAVWNKVIKLTAGDGISIEQNGDEIIISAGTSLLPFVPVNSTTYQMDSNFVYQPNNPSLVTLTLPLTAAAGDRISIVGYGAGGWSIAQNSGQKIILGNAETTPGVSGSISSTNQYDVLQLICVIADTVFQNISAPQGNLTLI